MTPEFYANEFRRFASAMNNVCENVELFACGSDGFDYDWTDSLMRCTKNSRFCHMNGFSMHFYCGGPENPLTFSDADWYSLLKDASRMEDIIKRNWHIICGHGMEDGTKLVNNLHTLFLAGGDKCITTPTYHVFDIFKHHQGAQSIVTTVTENDDFENSITVSASVKNNKTLVTIGIFPAQKMFHSHLNQLANFFPKKQKQHFFLQMICTLTTHLIAPKCYTCRYHNQPKRKNHHTQSRNYGDSVLN